jgi:hypothetical protein
MTEIATYDADRRLAVRVDPAAGSLERWAVEMQSAAQIARALAGTAFVPTSLQVIDQHGSVDLAATTATVAAALLTGREVGLEPMAALRSIDVIHGTPGMRALALRALVLQRGHELWLVESTKTRCIYRGRRAGSDHVQEAVWTIDRAKQLGIRGFGDPKGSWQRQPQNMLVARATAECARLVAPEALLGLPYVLEELDDLDDDAGPVATEAAPAPRRTARRRNPPPGNGKPAAAAPAADVDEDEPPLDDTPAPEPAPPPIIDAPLPDPDTADEVDDQYMITEQQMKALQAGFKDLGITDRGDRLAMTRAIIGRQIDSANDLYRAEASVVIDELITRKTRAAQQGEDDPFNG